MAHEGQFIFCEYVRDTHPSYFVGRRVLEVGSLDINGTVRRVFQGCDYTGLDIGPGPGVDVICKAHEYDAPDCTFDTICSCETFEHDMYLDRTLRNIVRMLKPNGLFFFTCATVGRREHGTVRANDSGSSPFTCEIPEWANYYKNLTDADIHAIIDVERIFKIHSFSAVSESPFNADLYFWGIKRDA